MHSQTNSGAVSVTPDGDGRCVVVWPHTSVDDATQPLGGVDLVGPLKSLMQDAPPAGSDEDQTSESAITGIILDLAGADYLNSAGIGSIFTLRRYAKENGAKMVISGPPATITRLLRTVNVPALIPVTSDLNAARKQLETGAS